MKYFKSPIILIHSIILSIALSWHGCGETTDISSYYYSTANTMVKTFALREDTLVMDSLQNIFFSIDLENGVIYNADSLPKGTDVSALAFEATFSSVSNAEVTQIIDGVSTVINHLNLPYSEFDFTAGDDNSISLMVLSSDGLYKRDYTIKVNVHTVVADSLAWELLESGTLPVPTDCISQKCVSTDNGYILFYTEMNGTTYTIESPDLSSWSSATLYVGEDMDWSTLISSGDRLFVISNNRELYECSDLSSLTFTECSLYGELSPYSLIGMREGILVGITESNSAYTYTYANIESGALTTAAVTNSKFPIRGFSNAIIVTSDWGTSQLIIACGELVDGSYTNAIWGFDGSSWAILNNINSGGNGAPITAREGAALIPYYSYDLDIDYDVYTIVSTYLLYGGWDGSSALRDLYYTSNLGGTWYSSSDSCFAVPNAIVRCMNADAFVVEESVNSNNTYKLSSNYINWTSILESNIETSLRLMSDTDLTAPYIYVVGGYNGSSYINQIWRGIITRFTMEQIK